MTGNEVGLQRIAETEAAATAAFETTVSSNTGDLRFPSGATTPAEGGSELRAHNSPSAGPDTAARCGLTSGSPYPKMHDCTCQGAAGHAYEGHWCPCGAAWRYCPDCGLDFGGDECRRCGYTFSLDGDPASAYGAVMA